MEFKTGDVVVVIKSRGFYTRHKDGNIGIVSYQKSYGSCFVDFGVNIGIREVFPWNLRLATKLDKLLAGIENAD